MTDQLDTVLLFFISNVYDPTCLQSSDFIQLLLLENEVTPKYFYS